MTKKSQRFLTFKSIKKLKKKLDDNKFLFTYNVRLLFFVDYSIVDYLAKFSKKADDETFFFINFLFMNGGYFFFGLW